MIILSSLWLPQDSAGTACGTYIKVSGRHPRDADGLGLAALHEAPGGLDREAMVLQGRHAVQAELDCLWAWELLLDGWDSAPWWQWVWGSGSPAPATLLALQQAARPTRIMTKARPARAAGAVLWSPSLGTAVWSGCSPRAARGWQVGPVCQCPAECSPGSPEWASAPRFLEREGLAGGWPREGAAHQGRVGPRGGQLILLGSPVSTAPLPPG